ncbi:hypothetical protein MMAG44476_22117 [Mycolicibacterium mageritense DSM 44476 = CIP 104973]|uniref:ATP-grasp domain-containing protein n=1 Tax=Mycolicibacterium canariasense TaxID=228230 RepID=A0A117I9J3_MYCCR|nr:MULTISPECIES: ATP-grasp domain-containing protein [Mycolicibacterium]MCC9179492.1 ATP-grasp domain-containing protein [Mycolicibacterium mageritense]GAS94835.1 uncharacterized protein RMCC_1801 [Mycolicibacterium canariasense]
MPIPAPVIAELTVVTHANWRVQQLCEHTAARQHFGMDLDGADDPCALFWCPGAWAAAATTRYPQLRLSSAGPRWLDTLPVAVTGREIVTRTAGAVAETATGVGSSVFAKLPESKHDCFAAAVRTPRELADACARLPVDEPVQLSTPVQFAYELRCWVRDGQVVASSPYFVDVDRQVWPQRQMRTCDREGRGWLQSVLDAGLDVPPAVVLDIGWCAAPATGPPGWKIVEANAAWSSDWYLADDMAAVCATVAASQRDVPDRWLWRPSPLLFTTCRAPLRR